ncbi:MAG: helix-turn-helix domain-containing protein [Anaerolineae bacterium]
MAFAPAQPLPLRPGDRDVLEAMVRKRTLAQRLVCRARIVLCCAEGLPHREIKRRLSTSVDTVIRWRARYEQHGIDGLQDRPRPGRPPTFSPSAAT